MTGLLITQGITNNAVSNDHIVSLADQLRYNPSFVPPSASPTPPSVNPEDSTLALAKDAWWQIGDKITLATNERAVGFCSLRWRCDGNGTTYGDLVSVARRKSDVTYVVLDAASGQASANGATVDLDVTLAIDGAVYDIHYFAYRTTSYAATLRRFTAHQRVMKK